MSLADLDIFTCKSRASCMRGQVCIVIPEKNAAIAVMSDLETDTEEMRQCIWNTIYPRLYMN